MKTQELRQIIREEISKVLNEDTPKLELKNIKKNKEGQSYHEVVDGSVKLVAKKMGDKTLVIDEDYFGKSINSKSFLETWNEHFKDNYEKLTIVPFEF